jgi:hypothetical protein
MGFVGTLLLGPLILVFLSCSVKNDLASTVTIEKGQSKDEKKITMLALNGKESVKESDIPPTLIAPHVFNLIKGFNPPGSSPWFVKRFEYTDARHVEMLFDGRENSGYLFNHECVPQYHLEESSSFVTGRGVFQIPDQPMAKRLLTVSIAFGLKMGSSNKKDISVEETVVRDIGFQCKGGALVQSPPLTDEGGGGFDEIRAWITKLIDTNRIHKNVLSVHVEEVIGRKHGSEWALSFPYTYEVVFT